MSDATTPANPTGQIATTPATYDWRRDMDSIESCEDVWDCADGCCTNIMPRHNDECIRLAAYIESLLADLDAANARADEAEAMCEWMDGELTEAYRAHYSVQYDLPRGVYGMEFNSHTAAAREAVKK